MYLAQVPKTPGLHLAGIADLSPANAKTNLERVGWKAERYAAPSLDAAFSSGLTHVGDDWQALVAHPLIDIIVEATGNPIAAVDHALAAFKNGKHVVMVTVEADAMCGPLLARRAKEAGVVYSLAYGDQPALICDLVDWARASGFSVVAAGRGPQVVAAFRAIDAGNGVGLLRPHAGAGKDRRPESEDVQFLPRRLQAGHREHRRVQCDRPDAGASRPAVSARQRRRHSQRDAPDIRRRPPASQGPGGSDLLAGNGRPGDSLRHPLRRIRGIRGRDRVHPQLLQGIHGAHRLLAVAMPACTSAGI